MSSFDETELERRVRKYAQILTAQAGDAARMTELVEVDAHRAHRRAEVGEILAAFLAGGSVAEFRSAIDKWCRQPGYAGFNGPNGQMFLNQMVGAADEDVVAPALRAAIAAPANEQQAEVKLRDAVAFVESVRKGPAPTPARLPFACSFFWSLQNPVDWPVAWPSAITSLQELSWYEPTGDYAVDYVAFRSVVRQLEAQEGKAEHALFWFDKHRFTGLDPGLVDRAQEAVAIYERRGDTAYQSEADRHAARAHARSLVAELRLLGRAEQDQVAAALGRSVKAVLPGNEWAEGVFRADGWMTWRAGASGGPGVRVWADAWGVALGVYPGFPRSGWYDEVPALIEGIVPTSASVMRFAPRGAGSRRFLPDEDGRGTECLIGWWYPGADALDRADLLQDIVRVCAELQPVLDALVVGAENAPGAEIVANDPPLDDWLLELKAKFIDERAYPSDKDIVRRAEREELARALRPDELPVSDLSELRSIINTNRYGNPGPQSILNTSLRDADSVELERILDTLIYLCWGDDTPEARINEVLDPDGRFVKGLGESVIMKLLAITDPERFLPVFPYLGDMGKVRMLKLLDLVAPDASLSRGERQVAANDALRARLDPLFPGDPWGQAQFLYWLNARGVEAAGPGTGTEEDPLVELAERLLVPKEFLDDIVALLRDKGQVVLYGPPGTGKTYLARELSRVLAPDPNRRMLVQFHPSTTYEDFFEGYRPEDVDGQLRYRLTKGPLALLADRAEQTPGQRHVMVIDEINRANLPKVLGELLFLLEYREEAVRTLYRPDDTFELPSDLWIIGTMNTADRSIALIDAALRRRFHFVPFFPNDGPMEGLLARWLEKQGEPTWVAELVDMVNTELVDELGGPHLQLGPSHFMRTGIDEAGLERIWKYNVYPFVEDQLFGEPHRIARFEFTKVLQRFRELVGDAGETEVVAEPEADDLS